MTLQTSIQTCIQRLSIVACATVVTASCSVLRIDVDVYKGPLANSEDVQTEQLASMAIGAHPLLVQLRDTMEWADVCQSKSRAEKQKVKVVKEDGVEYRTVETDSSADTAEELVDCIENKRKEAEENKCYKAGYFSYKAHCKKRFGAPKPHLASGYTDYQATRVNDLLALYKNIDFSLSANLQARAGDSIEVTALSFSASSNALSFQQTGNVRPWETQVRQIRDLGLTGKSADQATQNIVRGTNVLLLAGAVTGLLERGRDTLLSFAYALTDSEWEDSRGLPLSWGNPEKWISDPLEVDAATFVLRSLLERYPEQAAQDLLNLHRRLQRDPSLQNLALFSTHRLLQLNHTEVEQRAWRESVLPTLRERGLTLPYNALRPNSSFLFESVGNNQSERDIRITETYPDGEGRLSNEGRGSAGMFEVVTGYSLVRDFLDKHCASHKRDNLHLYPKEKLSDTPNLQRLLVDDLTQETVSEIYKEETVACDRARFDFLAIRSIMAHTLTQFSSKLLTIANNEILLEPTSEHSLIPNLVNPASWFGKDVSARKRLLERYVLVLQAIGNSILVQADELRRRELYLGRITDETLLHQECRSAEEILEEFRTNRRAGAVGLTSRTVPHSDGKVTSAPVSPVESRSLDGQVTSDGAILQTKGAGQTKRLCEGDHEANTTVEALDGLITALRYLEIRETAALQAGEVCPWDAGAASGNKPVPEQCRRVSRIKAALKIAYEQRSGMAYIRPPAAYLRTSFAATGLQQDAGLGWNNMLQEHGFRTSFGTYVNDLTDKLINNKDVAAEKDRLRTLTAIDKQFWQNVNSVRLAGAGNTNYVLVKDDIGNWYAKGFEGDPEPILRGIQSTALLALGGQLNANLLSQLDLRRQLRDPDLSPTDRVELTRRLEELEDANQESYRTGGKAGVDRSVTLAMGEFQETFIQRAIDDERAIGNAITRSDETTPLLIQIRTAWNDSLANLERNDGHNRLCEELRKIIHHPAEVNDNGDDCVHSDGQADARYAALRKAVADAGPPPPVPEPNQDGAAQPPPPEPPTLADGEESSRQVVEIAIAVSEYGNELTAALGALRDARIAALDHGDAQQMAEDAGKRAEDLKLHLAAANDRRRDVNQTITDLIAGIPALSMHDCANQPAGASNLLKNPCDTRDKIDADIVRLNGEIDDAESDEQKYLTFAATRRAQAGTLTSLFNRLIGETESRTRGLAIRYLDSRAQAHAALEREVTVMGRASRLRP